MKKQLIALLLSSVATIILTNKAWSQSEPRFGIKAGANLTTLGKFDAGDETYNYDYRFGFKGGFFADLPIASELSFMPQVLYSQKGGKVTGNSGTLTGTVNTKISYLDVPLLIGIKPLPELTFSVGPQVSFLLSQSTTATLSSGSTTAITTTSTDTENFRKSLIGGNVGVGYAFNNNVGLTANYIFDFQSIGNDDQNEPKAKNSGFGLTLDYSF